MKKLYFLLTALCLFNGATSQIINIPNMSFKSKLLVASPTNTIAKNLSGVFFKIDANNNGEIEVNEALMVGELDVSNSKIASLEGIVNFSNLTSLVCNNNGLTSLNLQGLIKLTKLNCCCNQLTILNLTGFSELNNLSCGYNSLTSLDLSGLTKLTDLDYSSNQMPSLNLSGLTNLTNLSCSSNHITSLDLSGLTNLTDLSCPSNQITSLDLSGLTKLKKLYCNSNQITNLDLSVLSLLSVLNSSSNQITSLNLSGLTQLSTLDCKSNQLTSLDLSGLSLLSILNCSSNQITSLNLSGLNSLSQLQCISNPNLETLFMKDVIQYSILNIAGCPNLKYICANEKLISKVQFEIDKNNYTNCHVNSYCTFEPEGTYYTIQGATKLDKDANGCDANDTICPNLKFSITDGTTAGGLITDASGNYIIPVQKGTHTITPIIENPTYFTVSPTNFQVSFPTATSPYTQNFCITPNGVHNDLEVTVVPLQPARPGFDAKYKLVYKNKGNYEQSGIVSLNFDDAILDFVLSSPVAISQVLNNLSWNYTGLQPFETREIDFVLNVNTPTETPAVNGGDVLHYTATISSVGTDETPVDNTFELNQTVVNSLDPNDKTCLEGRVITPDLIGQYVHYMIRFENTGTFPAQNIVVKDVIDLSKFDISTLVPTSASHSFVTRITNGNKVEFIFENINLPFDDAINDGYITFKIKTLPTLVVGDSFENEANIYFDYNFPILTNKATSTFQALGIPDFEFSNYFSLYPNPVKNVLNLSVKNTIEVGSISVYNTLGQMVIAVPNAETVSAIDVANLTSGTYFIKVNTNKGTSNAKFIKN